MVEGEIMTVEIQHCRTTSGFGEQAERLAAEITKATGEHVILSTGVDGQYDVFVNTTLVASRTGGFFTRVILRKGWPDTQAVIDAVKSRKQKQTSRT